jgi:ankyrin repeat protein
MSSTISSKGKRYTDFIIYFQDFFSARDQLGNTVFHTCVMTGNLEVLKRLIKSCKGGRNAVNMCNEDGKTALFLACQGASGGAAGNMEELAKALVQHGADKASSRDEFPEFNFLDGDNTVVAADPDTEAAPTEPAPPTAVHSEDLPLDLDSAEHAKAALKIQNRARVKNAEKETARLKAEGKLPGQLRAKKIEE